MVGGYGSLGFWSLPSFSSLVGVGAARGQGELLLLKWNSLRSDTHFWRVKIPLPPHERTASISPRESRELDSNGDIRVVQTGGCWGAFCREKGV
ncbi:hypothetical protein MARINON1_50723 [Marinobacter salarius]|nr:hypothetical protein MBHK15_130888 [Marinobacter salarius]VXB55406.1 hypothetical protein MARINON1_50723 [Marinobacter salarius]